MSKRQSNVQNLISKRVFLPVFWGDKISSNTLVNFLYCFDICVLNAPGQHPSPKYSILSRKPKRETRVGNKK
jgi:hypothetical protein